MFENRCNWLWFHRKKTCTKFVVNTKHQNHHLYKTDDNQPISKKSNDS